MYICKKWWPYFKWRVKLLNQNQKRRIQKSLHLDIQFWNGLCWFCLCCYWCPLWWLTYRWEHLKFDFFGIEKFNFTKLLFKPHAAARCAAVLLLMAVYWWVSHYSFISLSVSLKNQDWWGPSPAHHLPSPCNPLPFTWSHLN